MRFDPGEALYHGGNAAFAIALLILAGFFAYLFAALFHIAPWWA